MDVVALLLSLSQVPSCIISHKKGSGAQNADGKLPYLFIGVLGASLVYSLLKPCGSLVGFQNVEHLQGCRIWYFSLKDTLILTYSSGWLFCWGVCPHHGPLGHHRPQLARGFPRSEVAHRYDTFGCSPNNIVGQLTSSNHSISIFLMKQNLNI